MSRVDPVLADDAARSRTLGFASRIDERLSGYAGLELQLHRPPDGDGPIDLSFMLQRAQVVGLLSYLARTGSADLEDDPVIASLVPIAHEWANPGQALGLAGGNAWFEFDLPADGSDIAKPGFFMPFRDHRQVSSAPSDPVAIVEAVSQLLRGVPLSPSDRAIMERIVDVPGWELRQVGCFAGRPGAPIRIEVDSRDPANFTARMRDLGWTGDAERLDDLVRRIPEPSRLIAIDLQDGLQERVGPMFMTGRESDSTVLSTLVDLGYVDAGRAAALARYDGEAWEPIPGRDSQYYVRLRTSHVKVVLDPGQRVQSKAYLRASRQSPDARHREVPA